MKKMSKSSGQLTVVSAGCGYGIVCAESFTSGGRKRAARSWNHEIALRSPILNGLKASRMTCLCGTGKMEVIAIGDRELTIDSLGVPKQSSTSR